VFFYLFIFVVIVGLLGGVVFQFQKINCAITHN
jgi:hypothetical protein